VKPSSTNWVLRSNSVIFFFKCYYRDDIFAQDSIELLKSSGIDFERFEKYGIDVQYFGECMMMSGLVLNEDVKWISFHSSYDFGYLLKTLTCCDLAIEEPAFLDMLTTFFPCIYDVKVKCVFIFFTLLPPPASCFVFLTIFFRYSLLLYQPDPTQPYAVHDDCR
jgi:hypothetical protein